ncbi:hypothetical protein Tco_0843488 [Tanacetum coccineum]|uniref:Uncharacterized protein n=1 Tax=Tanacetum coccineum TaxID=301880 RepID=A0ABQ5B343_9ASTR
MCREEEFKAIQYWLGPNEEYIAIRRCEYDIWERNEDNMSKSTKIFFRKMTTDGWLRALNKEKLKKRSRERNIDEYWWRVYKSGDLEVLES